LKLRITIDGKAYDAEVEILEGEESAPEYPAYPAVSPAFVPAAIQETAPAPQPEAGENDKECRSPVTGMVVKVNVEAGQAVQAQEVVAVLESMKMEMQIAALHDGVVKNVLITTGSSVKVNQLLVEFE
jgi:biotin carboxyl carrier protein